MLERRAAVTVAEELRPTQLGIGTRQVCEAAVHAIREYYETHNGNPNHIILKLDLKNEFNSVIRAIILQEIQRRYPAAVPLFQLAYSWPSPLYLGTTRIWSSRGVQESDPLHPLLFSFAIAPIIKQLETRTNVLYLDDATLAGPLNIIKADLNRLIPELHAIRLKLNHQKCEATDLSPVLSSITGSINGDDEAILSEGETLLLQAHLNPLSELTLLGA